MVGLERVMTRMGAKRNALAISAWKQKALGRQSAGAPRAAKQASLRMLNMKLAETIRKQNAKIKKLQLFVKNTKIVKTTKKACRPMKVMKVVKRKVQQVVCSASSASSKTKRTS